MPQPDNFDSDTIDSDEENIETAEDVDLRPGPNADHPRDIEPYISAEVRERYDVYSYRHAAAILANSFPKELQEIEKALLNFTVTTKEIGMPGGNESEMPKKLSRILRPVGWVESRIQGDLLVRLAEYGEIFEEGKAKLKKVKRSETTPRVIKNFIDGHKIDYVKGRVAFDLEWNSKDQTFDRDLYALRAFHDCGLVSVGILLTRSANLNPAFEMIPQLDKAGEPVLHTKGPNRGMPKSVKDKYGASTTWMGKLLYRLNAGRHGGCPVLVFGITQKLISDWNVDGK